MTLISIVILGFLFSLLHFSTLSRNFSDLFVENLQKKVDIAVFLLPDASESRISAFRNFLNQKKQRGEIVNFWELTKEEALSEFSKEFPDETQFLENYQLENPLRDIFGIIPLSQPNSAENIRKSLLTPDWAGTIDIPLTQQKNEKNIVRVEQFLRVTAFWKSVMAVSALLFVGIVFVIVFHLTGLMIRSRSREISIMRLVGARIGFIRAPFVLESLLVAMSAFCFSIFLFWMGFGIAENGMISLLSEIGVEQSFVLDFFSDPQYFQTTLLYNALLGGFVALVAAIFAVERSLRRENLSDF